MEKISSDYEKPQKVNIQGAIRVGPMPKREIEISPMSCIYVSDPQTIYHNRIDSVNNLREMKFDYVFDETVSQTDVYTQSVSPIVKQAVDGYNGAIFGYGQTGTGKKHTMYGKKTKYIANL